MTALKLAAASAAATALLLSAGTASAQQNIRTATSWPGGVHLEQFAQGFAKQADALTGGKVKFQIFPAGTIGSPLKITESVQKKVAQAGHSWPGYDWGIDKAAAIFGGYVGSPPAEALLHWVYAAGGIELWREWRMEKFGVVGIPCGAHSDEIHMHSQEAHPYPRGPQGPEAPHLGRLGRGCDHARRLDRHPAWCRGLSGARARRRRRDRMGDPGHQSRPRLPQGRQVHHPARRAPARRRARVRVRQGAVGQLRRHHQDPDRGGCQAVDAQFLDGHQHDGCRRAREAQGGGRRRSSASTSPISTASPRRPGRGRTSTSPPMAAGSRRWSSTSVRS